MVELLTDNTTTTVLNHPINRCNLQALYDETIEYINQHHPAAVVVADMYQVFTDVNGNTLESLKQY